MDETRIRLKNTSISEASHPINFDKVGRGSEIAALTQIVLSSPDGFVLSLDAPWGAGKTTFVLSWIEILKSQKLKTVYLNAWENDFNSDPLSTILAELKDCIGSENTASFNKVISVGSKLLTAAIPTLLEGVLANYIGSETIPAAIKKINEVGTEILNEEINDYLKKKKSLKEFKIILAEYIKTNLNGKPLVFFVDELDRCKPSYAVELLEHIKHFFNIEGIVFVLSIHKKELCNAVRGYYGSDSIDANHYLKRFIDLEYKLQKPSLKNFLTHRMLTYGIDKAILRNKNTSKYHRTENFISLAIALGENQELQLREYEKLFARFNLVLRTFSTNASLPLDVLYLLLVIRESNYELYEKFQDSNNSCQVILSELIKYTPRTDEGIRDSAFYYLVATFLTLFNRTKHHSKREELYALNDNIISTPLEGIEVEEFPSDLKNFNDYNYDWSSMNLKYFFPKIDLIETLQLEYILGD